jgi:hypothetical protein
MVNPHRHQHTMLRSTCRKPASAIGDSAQFH